MAEGNVAADVRAALVAHALELRDGGADDWLERACARHPDLRDEVAAAVAEADALPAIFTAGASVDRRVGTELAARHRLLRRLGAGAMGVVYEAHDRQLGRSVAVKVLRPDIMDPTRALPRFEREARAMAAVAHPAVVAVHDLGHTGEGEPYLVMDYVEGVQLATILERLAETHRAPSEVTARSLAELGIRAGDEASYIRTIVGWTADLAAGLAHVHDAGVIHRDVKPSNIMVRPDGRAMLLDFGVAHLEDGAALTRGQTSVGTPAYMPPEALDRGARATVQGDVYSLAAVLYSLLALRAPYTGSPVEVLAQLSTREPAPLARLQAGLPRDLVAIVEQGMSRRPAGRYATAPAFETDLRSFLAFRPVTARPIGPLRRLTRRLVRSRLAQGAFAALAIVTVALIAREVRAQHLADRQELWSQISRAFPPNFPILNPENRVYRFERDRQDLERLLDRAAEVCVDPLPTYLLRASFRLDHGDPAGAAADMAVLARHEGTPYAEALAAAYAEVAPGSAGSDAVPLSDLPAPRTPRDRYLAGFHFLREGEHRDPEAIAALDDEVVAAVPHAAELRFALTWIPETMEPSERQRAALDLLGDVRRYEARLGRSTAATDHFAGYAMGLMNQYENALEVCEEGIALAPRSHVLRTNAAFSALALGLFDEAREHLAVALELRPNDFKPAETLVWTCVAERDYDRALAEIDRLGPGLDRMEPGWEALMSGAVGVYRALEVSTALEPERRKDSPELAEAIAQARARYDEARRAGATPSFGPPILDALEQGSDEAVFVSLALQCLREPRRLWRSDLLLRHFPDQLGPEGTGTTLRVLSALHAELAGSFVSSSLDR